MPTIDELLGHFFERIWVFLEPFFKWLIVNWHHNGTKDLVVDGHIGKPARVPVRESVQVLPRMKIREVLNLLLPFLQDEGRQHLLTLF